MKKDKLILDACCGSRMFWFDKHHPNTVYADIRHEEYTLCDGRKLEIAPDVVADFTHMPFADNKFYHVVFDPPHMKHLGKNTWMAKKYGVLLPTWESDLKAGFDECMRVLKPYGTLIFKWSEAQITTARIIEILGQKPLYGHPTAKHGKTIWLAFMKIPHSILSEGVHQAQLSSEKDKRIEELKSALQALVDCWNFDGSPEDTPDVSGIFRRAESILKGV